MGLFIGKERKARRCYGFDEVALVPGPVTINPNEVNTDWEIAARKFRVPILAAAMDGVVDGQARGAGGLKFRGSANKI